MSQKPLLGSVLKFPHGESDTVRELRGCQAQVTPSVPLSLSVRVSIVVGWCVCVSLCPQVSVSYLWM